MQINDFPKIKSIVEIQNLGLPTPKTVFVFDAEKQENEIEEFVRDRDFLMIRSDHKINSAMCPHNLKCPRNDVKNFIKELNSKGYAAILQEHVPWTDTKISGNILLLKNQIIVELMKGGPLTLLKRHGKMDEHIRLERHNSCKELFHWGKRIASQEMLQKIVSMVERLPFSYKIVEFAFSPEWLYFWQIQSDETSKLLEY